MFVIIEDPSTREILMQRELQGDELLDCELYAKEYFPHLTRGAT
jgi:hypothetical protein